MKVVYKLSNPNYRQKLSTISIMQDLMIAVCGLAVFSVVMQFVQNGSNYGIKAIGIYAAAIITGVLTDMLAGKIFARNDAGQNKYLNTVLSPVVTSTIFALTLPIGTPIYVVVIGAFIAIFFGKAVYGGFGMNIFNPALVGRVIVHISFSSKLVAYLPSAVDAVTSSTPTTALASAGWTGAISTSLGGLLLGNYAGALGETCTILILAVGIWLGYRKVFDWRIPASYIGTAFILAFVVGCVVGINPFTYGLTHIAIGGIMFGAIIMATDPVTSPTSPLGKIIFGICLGILTMLIRLKGTFPEGVLFSILIMNMFTPLIDNLTLGKTDTKYNKQIIAIAVTLLIGIGLIAGVATGLEKPAKEVNVSLEGEVYTVETSGFGAFKVDVTIADDGQMAVKVIEHNETPGFGADLIDGSISNEAGKAFYNTILASTFTKDDLDGIDLATSATLTATGIKDAVYDAMTQAGLVEEEEPEVEVEALTAENIADGTYVAKAEGFAGDIEVTIVVEGGKITAATLVGDSETPTIGGAALEDLQDQIIAANGNGIDGVSGATYTSNGAKDAVAAAIESASTDTVDEPTDVSETTELADGTFTGTGKGCLSDVEVTIVVEGGKITEATIVADGETPTIGGAAVEELQEQIVAANGSNIDGVTGATMTSNGVKDAVDAALAN